MREAGSSRAGRPGTTLPGAQKRADVGVSFKRRKKKRNANSGSHETNLARARAILAARACRHFARGAEANALLKFRASSASASRWRLRNNSVNPVGRHGGGNGDWRAAPRPLAGDLAEALAGGRGAAWPAVLSGNKNNATSRRQWRDQCTCRQTEKLKNTTRASWPREKLLGDWRAR